MPAARPFVGVKVAARVRPVPVMVLRVPLAVAISLSENPVGSFVKVKVMPATSPILTDDLEVEMITEGAEVSMVMAGVAPAPPALPAASV